MQTVAWWLWECGWALVPMATSRVYAYCGPCWGWTEAFVIVRGWLLSALGPVHGCQLIVMVGFQGAGPVTANLTADVSRWWSWSALVLLASSRG